ncbi:helix-turn-helix domain-containing protein [Rhodovulum strictum]|nr:helix-turn-helix domain-containing protein [Rhodovulum strictum]
MVRHGVALPNGKAGRDPMLELRETVMDLRPADAVDLLLSVVADLAGQDDDRVGNGLGLTRMQRALFCALYRREGQVIPHTALYAALWPGVDEPRADCSAKVLVCSLRKALSGLARVEPVFGEGYRLVREDGVVFSWETDR